MKTGIVGASILWATSVRVTRTIHMFDLTALSAPGIRSADLVGRALSATGGAGGKGMISEILIGHRASGHFKRWKVGAG